MRLYNAAMKGISTKLEVLDDDFQIHHSHNPIRHLECSIKGINSSYENDMQMYSALFLYCANSLTETEQTMQNIRICIEQ